MAAAAEDKLRVFLSILYARLVSPPMTATDEPCASRKLPVLRCGRVHLA